MLVTVMFSWLHILTHLEMSCIKVLAVAGSKQVLASVLGLSGDAGIGIQVLVTLH